MTNLEKLEKEIRLKLPRLMELSEGCLFKYKPRKDLSIKFDAKIHLISVGGQIADTGDYDDVYVDFHSNYNGFENLPIDIIENFDIIGHEIKLNDVLEWFNVLFGKGDCGVDFGKLASRNKLLRLWNFETQYLKDQSQELIDSLFRLIKN